jgi:hypothetical protein
VNLFAVLLPWTTGVVAMHGPRCRRPVARSVTGHACS